MGDEADGILASLCMTEEESDYEKVKKKFDNYFIGARNVIYARTRFNQRCQEAGESVDAFVTALHKLIEHCEYGVLKEEMVRDRIDVCLRDDQLSEKLQLDANLTLKRVIDQARQKETVRKHQAVVRGSPQDGSTHTNVEMVQERLH